MFFERLERDGTVIRYKVKIRHKHVWKIRTPFGTKKVTTYSVTSYVEGEFDALNPAGVQTELCVNTPVERQCFNLRELIEIVASLLWLQPFLWAFHSHAPSGLWDERRWHLCCVGPGFCGI